MLEYSNNLESGNRFGDILSGLQKELAGTGLFNINDFKSRAVAHEVYCIGEDNNGKGFAACNLSILSGRDDDTKKKISDLTINFLAENINKPEGVNEVNVTVQISELHKPSYRKVNI